MGTLRIALPQLTMNAWLRFDSIRDDVRVAKPRTVLEIGAGEGALGAWLARQFGYTGVEPDDVSRSIASRRLATLSGARVLDDLESAGGEVFDLVCAFEVLEHIDADVKALERWRENLRDGGWLLLSVPAHSRRMGAWDEMVGHHRRYDRTVLVDRLEESGYSVVRIESYGAGLGQVLEAIRNRLAARHGVAKRATAIAERTSASARLLQPRSSAAVLTRALVAAPFRLLQRPFVHSEVGTGYVVLARSEP